MILLGMIGTQEIIFILIIILVLFGAKKIPELMRGLGKGVKEFKDGMNGLDAEKDTEKKAQEQKTQEQKTSSEN